MFSLIRSICLVCGLGGLSTSVTLLISSGGANKNQVKVIKPKRIWPKDYEQTCYKWVFYGPSSTKGELAACLDKNGSSSSSSPLIFVLGWFEGNISRFLAVDSIKVEGSQISFQFTHPNRVKGMEGKKLDIPPKHPSLKNNLDNLNKLNDKKLKDICSISSTKLNCNSVGYEAETRQVTWYF